MGLYAKIKETVTEAVLFGLAPLATRTLGFVLTLVYANHLSKANLGRLGLLLAAEAFLTQVLDCGIVTSYFRSYYDDNSDARRRRVTSTTAWFMLAVNLAFVAALVPFVDSAGLLIFDKPYPELVSLTLALTFFDTLNKLPFVILKARKESKLYVTVAWVTGLFQFCFIYLFVAILGLGVAGAMLGIVMATAMQSALYFVRLRRFIAFEFSWKELAPLLALGLPTIFNSFATKMLIASDRFIVDYFHGEQQVGIYEFANRFAAVLPILVANPFSLIWPAMRFQVMKDEDAGEYYSRVLTYLTFLLCYFGLGVAALAPDVVRGLVHRDYSAAIPMIPLIVLVNLLATTNKGINVGLMIEKKAYWNIVVVVATALLNLVLNFALIPKYGVYGAIWSTIVAYAFCNWFRYYMSNKFYPVTYEWWRIAKMFAVALALYGATQLVVLPSALLSFVLRFLIAVTYPLVLHLLGFYDERERRRFGEIWGQMRVRAGRVIPALKPPAEIGEPGE